MAKNTNFIPLKIILRTRVPLEAPLCKAPRNEKGNAMPIAKRKNGKTKSTQVMPGNWGLNTKSGGAIWAWNSQAGKSLFRDMVPESTIPKMANPLKTSRLNARLVILPNKTIKTVEK